MIKKLLLVSLLCVLSLADVARAKEVRVKAARTKEARAKEVGASNSGAASTGAKRSSSGVAATVQTEGALVYSRPDFDANVLATLNYGAQVRVSKGTTGDVAKFHRVRVGPVLGYISDVDVSIEGGGESANSKIAGRRGTKKDSVKTRAKKEPADRDRLPMAFTRYFGLTVGQSEFKGAGGSASLLTYGFKVTGPDTIIDGPISDFSITLHYGAPEFLKSQAATEPTGFVLFTDLHLLMPFLQKDDGMGYLGLGPVLVISDFKYGTGSGVESLTSYNPGVSLLLGGGFRVERVAVRIEGKYLFEKQSYNSLNAAVMTDF